MTARRPTVALSSWGDLFEDFYDTIGVTLEDFRDDLTGGWLFGYVDALRTQDLDSVLVFVSARVRTTTRFVHGPTGARVVLLPQPRRHRVLRSVRERLRSRGRRQFKVLGSLASYLSVPLVGFQRELRRERVVAHLSQDYEHARFDLFVLLGRLAGRPVFASFQGGVIPFSRIERVMRPRAIRACAGLVIGAGVEHCRVRDAYGVDARRIANIPNALDVDAYATDDRSAARLRLGISPTTRVVGWHGRVVIHRKGLDVLLDAWELVCVQRPDVDLLLLLVGTGTDAADLHLRIAGMSAGKVRWRDEYISDRTELGPYLAAADIYALSSRHEGFPVAPIEAMASGLPIVACDAPGVSDILENGEDSGGILVPCEDVDALARGLGRLVDDPELSRELGRRARQRVEERYSLRAVGEALRSFLVPAASRPDARSGPDVSAGGSTGGGAGWRG